MRISDWSSDVCSSDLLQLGGEVIGDIAFKEPLQKGRHQPPLLLGDEAVLLHQHIGAVLQRLERGGIGGGSADTQFLQLLDEACLGIAGRRLGEVLLRLHRSEERRVGKGGVSTCRSRWSPEY